MNKNDAKPHLYKHGWIRVDAQGNPVNEHTGGPLPHKIAEIAKRTDPIGIKYGPGSKEHSDAVHAEVSKLMAAGDHNTAEKVLDRHWYHVQPKVSYMSGPFPKAGRSVPPVAEIRDLYAGPYRSREVRRRYDRQYAHHASTAAKATHPVVAEDPDDEQAT